MAVASLCRAGLNLFQINSQVVGGEYAAPLLLGISKRSILEGQASTPAYAAYTGWHADTMFSLVPSKTQVAPFPPSYFCLPREERHMSLWHPTHRPAARIVLQYFPQTGAKSITGWTCSLRQTL